jgi:hypothetical protein
MRSGIKDLRLLVMADFAYDQHMRAVSEAIKA